MTDVSDKSLKTKILFICSSNKDRSRTAEDLYKNDPRFEVKSAGVDSDADTPVNIDLIHWADIIVVMNEKHDRQKFKLIQMFPFLEPLKKKIIDFDIPDAYLRGDPELVRLIKTRMLEHFS